MNAMKIGKFLLPALLLTAGGGCSKDTADEELRIQRKALLTAETPGVYRNGKPVFLFDRESHQLLADPSQCLFFQAMRRIQDGRYVSSGWRRCLPRARKAPRRSRRTWNWAREAHGASVGSDALVGPDAHRVRLSARHAVTRDASRKRAKRLPQTHARRRHLRQTGGPAACDKAPGRREERPETPAHRADGRHDMRVPVRHSRSTGPKRNLRSQRWLSAICTVVQARQAATLKKDARTLPVRTGR